MELTRLQRLKSLLYNRIPVVGGGLRRMAARQLADWAHPAAIGTLAAIIDLPDTELQHIVLQALEKVQSQAAIDAVCAVWSRTRHPALGEVVARHAWVADDPPLARALSALHSNKLEAITNGRGELAAPLTALCQDSDAHIADRARECLFNLRGRYIIDAICALWAAQRDPLLEQAVMQGGYTARAPESLRILTLLKTGQGTELYTASPQGVEALVQACEDRDAQIATAAEAVLVHLEDPTAQQAACRLALKTEQPALLRAVVQGGYTPDNENDRALLFFLCGQWQRYEALDFDFSRLRTIYEAGEAAQRERITRQVRLSGRADFLGIIAGRDFQGRLDKMSPGEISTLVQILNEQKHWLRLWGLVFRLPVVWSLRVMQMLKENTLHGQTWQPEVAEERSLFWQLAELVTPEMLALFTSQEKIANPGFRQHLPPAVQRARAHLAKGRINAVAFSPNGLILALGTSRRKVALWDFRQARLANMLGEFNHSIGAVDYTPGGMLVLSERTNSQSACSVYRWAGNEPGVVFSNPGSITALAALNDDQVLITQRSGGIALAATTGSSQPIRRSLPYWARTMCVSASQEHAALFHHGVNVVALPSLEDAARGSVWNSVAHAGAFFPDGRRVAVGKYNGEVVLLHGRSLRREGQPLAQHQDCVEGLSILRKHPILVSAGAEGTLQFYDWQHQNSLGALGRNGDRLTSLRVSPDESFMAIGHADASVSIWDLRALDLPPLFEQPLDLAAPDQLAALSALVDAARADDAIPQPVKLGFKFVQLALQFRFRYDIEIDAVAEIKLGEYEIEIE